MSAVAQDFVSGYLGAVSVDGTAQPVTTWSGTESCPSFDATNSTSSGWQKRGRTILSLNGSFTVLWKTTSGKPSFTAGVIYPLILTAYTGETYTFNGYISSNAISIDIKGNVSFTASFESDGAVTYPT